MSSQNMTFFILLDLAGLNVTLPVSWLAKLVKDFTACQWCHH